MAIVKSAWNGPSAFGMGSRRQYNRTSAASNTKRSPFNRGGQPRNMGGLRKDRAMHSKFQARATGDPRVRSKHPDAVPKINFLHMN